MLIRRSLEHTRLVPVGPVEIDRSHSIGSRVKAAYLCRDWNELTNTDYVGEAAKLPGFGNVGLLSFAPYPNLGMTAVGNTFPVFSAANANQAPAWVSSPKMTLFWFGALTSATAGDSDIMAIHSGGSTSGNNVDGPQAFGIRTVGNNTYGSFWNNYGGSQQSVALKAGVQAICATFAVNGNTKLYVDGQRINQSSFGSTAPTITNYQIKVSPSQGVHLMGLALFIPAELTPAEVQALSYAPFSVFRRPGRRLIRAAAPAGSSASIAGSGVVSGNGVALVMTSGAITGSAAVSGSGLALAPASAAVVGSSDIIGTGSSKASSDGALVGSGVVSGAGAYIASSAAVVAGSATAAATGASTASSLSVLTGAATVSGAIVSISASSATLTGSGVVSGAGASIAASAATVAGSATVSGEGSFVSLTSYATLVGSSAIAAAGSSIAVSAGSAAGSGVVSAEGRAATASSMAAAGSGAVTGAGSSIATSSATIAGIGVVIGGSPITASSAALTGTSTVFGVGRLGPPSYIAAGRIARVQDVTRKTTVRDEVREAIIRDAPRAAVFRGQL